MGRLQTLFFGVMSALSLSVTLYAAEPASQLYLDHDTYVDLESEKPIEVDNSLFRLLISDRQDLYEEVNRYLYTPIHNKRRGVEWWQLRRITSDIPSAGETLTTPHDGGEARIFTSTSGYRVGASAKWNHRFDRGWGLESGVYMLTGRDMNIEGVFRQGISPTLTLTKDIAADHYLRIIIESPYDMRGLRSSATQECYDLTHNNLYNPSWGYYHGEVRNSRVARDMLPSLKSRYQRVITPSTIASVEISAKYGTRRVSRIGWYDAYNPSPNYYSKLPSNYVGTSSYDEVESVWQQNDTDYTQIAWDKLELINLSSSDGESHYVVEDRVESIADVGAVVLFDTELGGGFRVEYGVRADLYNHRNYKQMRDLLGGEYLLDIDQYAGDYVQVGNELQNNLRDPNRQITQGDRFGYDYTHKRTTLEAIATLEYRNSLFDTKLHLSVGDESIVRIGHYEKERFPGDGSYGESQLIALPLYNLMASVGYALSPQHYLSARVNLNAESPLSRYLFVADQNSNRVINSPTTEKITSAAIKYRYTTPYINLSAEGYILYTTDIVQVWSGYDDLSATYCDVVISDLATRSIGVEICGEFNVGRKVKLTSSLAFGGYTFSSAPLVTLYDDVDMSLVSESRASSVEGYIVGGAPQVVTRVGMTYFADRGLILNLDLSYLSQRYTSPSIIRRTDRILSALTTAETLKEVLTQERLDDIFNANFSIVKSLSIKRLDSRVLIVLNIDNIFNKQDLISSSREGNRIFSNSTYGYTPQDSSREYDPGRRIRLSVKYQF